MVDRIAETGNLLPLAGTQEEKRIASHKSDRVDMRVQISVADGEVSSQLGIGHDAQAADECLGVFLVGEVHLRMTIIEITNEWMRYALLGAWSLVWQIRCGGLAEAVD